MRTLFKMFLSYILVFVIYFFIQQPEFLILSTSFTTTFFILPPFIARIKERGNGFVSKDMNKFDKRKIPEFGGFTVFFGFLTGIIAAIALFSYTNIIFFDLTILLAGSFTVAIVGAVGIVDDLMGWKKGIAQWQHALVPAFAALPLMAIKISNPPIFLPVIGFLPSEFVIPFIGVVSFGLIYSLFFVPIGITGASNATNMLAGFNGLEAGLGILIIGTLFLISIINGKIEAAILSISLLAALIAFLFYNWFPAKVFGGDSLTLMVGAGIATISIVGDIEKIAVLLMLLYFIELGFKARHRFKSECFGIPQKNGILKPDPRGGSLTHWIMRRGKFTEPQVVKRILFLQLIISVTVALLSHFQLILI